MKKEKKDLKHKMTGQNIAVEKLHALINAKGDIYMGGGDVRGHVRTHDQFQYERLRFLSVARRSGGRRILFHLKPTFSICNLFLSSGNSMTNEDDNSQWLIVGEFNKHCLKHQAAAI